MDPRLERLRRQRQRQIERLKRLKLLRRPGVRQPPSAELGARRLVVILAFLLALLASVGAAVWSTRPQTLTVAAPHGEAEVAAFAERLQGVVGETRGRRLRVTVLPVGTVEEARDLLARGEVQLALIRSDVEPPARARSVAYLREDVALFLALTAPPAAPQPPGNASRPMAAQAGGGGRPKLAASAAGGRAGGGKAQAASDKAKAGSATAGKADEADEDEQDAAPADSESLTELLRGRAVGLLSGSPSEGLLRIILAKHGLGDGAFTIVQGEWEALVEKLDRREISALFVVESPLDGGFGPRLAAAAAGPAGPRLRVLEVPQGQALAKQTPGVSDYDLAPGELLSGPALPAEEVGTVSVTWRLVTRTDVSPRLIEILSEEIFEHRVAFADAGSIARTLKAPPVEKDVYVPIHPGTLVYVNEEPKSLMERYGDYVYIGMALAGLIASSFGYVAARIRAYAGW